MTCDRCGGDSGPYRKHADPFDCIGRMEAEVERLKAELDNETAHREATREEYVMACEQRDQAEAENERLKSEHALRCQEWERLANELEHASRAHAQAFREARDERDALRAEVERLKAAADNARTHLGLALDAEREAHAKTHKRNCELILRTEAAEAENRSVFGQSRHVMLQRVERAESERDALRAVLVGLRAWLDDKVWDQAVPLAGELAYSSAMGLLDRLLDEHGVTLETGDADANT